MQAVITSYNFLGQLRDNSKDLTFRVVIMDEAHYIKNKKVSVKCFGEPVCLVPSLLSQQWRYPDLQEAGSVMKNPVLHCMQCWSPTYLHCKGLHVVYLGRE